MKNSLWLRDLILLPLSLALSGFGQGIQTLSQPQLSIRPDGRQHVLLQWPASAAGYSVEESLVLDPTASWKPVALTPSRIGETFQARIESPHTQRYFRLRSPDQPPPGTVAFFLPEVPPTRGFDVEYDAAGRMHFVFVRHSVVREVQEVLYGTCEPGLECDLPDRWRTLAIHSGAIGTVQLEVTADGRPRVVLEDQYTVAGARLAYLACESDCLSPSGWNGLALFDSFQQGQAFSVHLDQRWFALDPNGGPRILASGPQTTLFLACNHDCTLPSGDWTSTPIDTTGDPFQSSQLFAPVLRIDSAGRPHILGQNNRALVYLSAPGDFRLPEAWQRMVLTDPLSAGPRDDLPVALLFADNLDMELDRQGALVAAFDGLVPGSNEPRTYLFRCSADCTTPGSWTGRPFPGTQVGALDLALAPNNQPYFLFAGQRVSDGERILQLATCDQGDCYDDNASWTARGVGHSSTLESERPVRRYPETPVLCSIPTTSWEFASSKLLFLPSGAVRLAINAAASSICAPGMSEWIDPWGTTRRGRTVDVWVIEARSRWSGIP